MAVYARGNIWHVRFQVNGQKYSESLGPSATKADAIAFEAKIRAEILSGKLGHKKVRTLDEAILEWLEGEAASLTSYPSLLVQFRSIQHLTKDKPLLTVVDVSRAVKKYGSEKGWAVATINLRLAFLRRVTNLARDQWGWIDEDLGRRIKLLRGEVKRDIFLTPAEVERLARCCEHEIVAKAIRLYARTGLREQELLRATEIRDECIVATTAKGRGGIKRARLIPVPSDMSDLTLPIGITYNTLRTYFEKARVKAGLPHVRVHDLRHTAASWLAQSGASLVMIRDLLGHTSFAETTRYSHLLTSDMKIAAENVTKFIQSNCTKSDQ